MTIELSIVVRATILLLGTTLLALALKRSSASVRHMIWTAGLLSTLVLPFALRAMPQLAIPFRPDSSQAMTWMTNAVAVATASSSNGTGVIAGSGSVHQVAGAYAFGPRQWVLLVWVIGAFLVVIRFAVGVWDVRRLARRAQPALETDWNQLMSGLKRDFDVHANVILKIGGNNIPPMTWGIRRHTILFPSLASGWTADRIRHAIAHELAHVKRGDGILQVMVQAACALYWFHPLAWYASYRIHVERERACDDQVLNIGAVPEDYAEDLLQIARETNAVSMASVSMMHRSGLTARVAAILDRNRRRAGISHRWTALLAVSAGITAILLSSFHLWAMALPLPPVVSWPHPVPVFARAEQPAKAGLPQAPPKWVGTWQLNKQDSRFGSDPKIQEMLDAVDTLTWHLDTVPGGLKVTIDLVGVRAGQRQQIEYALPFGAKTEIKDLIIVAPFLPPGSVSARAVGNDSLELVMSSTDFVEVVELQVSSDGNTLIESTTPSGFRLVLERR
jgi:beta-lactamase regulating signal transducer with metallopeptidase domain